MDPDTVELTVYVPPIYFFPCPFFLMSVHGSVRGSLAEGVSFPGWVLCSPRVFTSNELYNPTRSLYHTQVLKVIVAND